MTQATSQMTSSSHSELPPQAPQPPRGGLWPVLAVVVLAIVGAVAGFVLIADSDVFWHLACGRWMLDHQEVLNFDPYTADAPEPNAPWVNVYWMFQILIASLHAVGGFELLTVFQSLLAATVLLLVAGSLRKDVPPAWLVLSGLCLAATMADRVRVRPELVTMVFMTVTVVLLERVRRGQSHRLLWWLVPIMLAWVNMHGLYILGLGLVWSALLGSALDMRLGRTAILGNLPSEASLGPVLTATIACFLSPWPVEAALHPFVLWTRMSGQDFSYTYGVQELQPTWEVLGQHVEGMVLVALTVLAVAIRVRKVPAAHWVWLAAFVTLGLLARRNVALLAPVCGYLLALHGGEFLAAAGRRWRVLAKVSAPATALMLLVALAACGAYATGLVFRCKGLSQRFGAGLQTENFPVELARRLGETDGGGDIFCQNFGDAAAFLNYSFPKHKVWLDGRLEVHSAERFRRQQEIQLALGEVFTAERIALPDCVRFVIVRHDAPHHLAALMQCGRFRLIAIDPAGACFERTDWTAPPSDEPQTAIADFDLQPYDRPLEADGSLAGLPPAHTVWYQANPFSLAFRMGGLLLSLGEMSDAPPPPHAPLQHRCTLLATRYFMAASAEDTPRPQFAKALLAKSLTQWARQTHEAPSAAAPIDIHMAESLAVLNSIDLRPLSDQHAFTFVMEHVQCLLEARQFDTALKVFQQGRQFLPPRQRVSPPAEYAQESRELTDRIEQASAKLDKVKSAPIVRAAYVGRDLGLIEQAVDGLKAAGPLPPDGLLTLGDLLLRRGLPREAREAYSKAAAAGALPWAVTLRLALCDWAGGDWAAAARQFDLMTDSAGHPLAQYYHALLLEQSGQGPRARSLAESISTDHADADLVQLIQRLRQRL